MSSSLRMRRPGGRLAAAVAVAIMISLLTVGLVEGPASAAPVRYDLRLTRATAGVVATGSRQAFIATVPRRLAGKRAVLWRKTSAQGAWVRVGHGRVRAGGRAVLRGVAIGSGYNWWRTTIRGRHGTVLHTSRQLATAVYSWYYLADLDIVEDGGLWDDSSSIGSQFFAKSVVGDVGYDEEDYATYNLSYKCLLFDTSYGLDNTSESGGKAQLSVDLDGATRVLGAKTVGQASHATLNVAGHMRIRLDATDMTGYTYESLATFGNARILCSGKP